MIKLMPVEPQHLSWLRNQRNRKEIRDFCRQPYLLNEVNQDDWLKDCSRKRSMIPFMVCDVDTWVGYAAISNVDWISKRGECSYFIAPEFMDKGHGEEAVVQLLRYAFMDLGLQKVHSDTFDYNERECEFNRKMGFKESGRLIRHYFKRGKLIDSILFYMLREDFEQLYPNGKYPESKPL